MLRTLVFLSVIVSVFATSSAQAEVRLLVKSHQSLKGARPLQGLSGWHSLRVPNAKKQQTLKALEQDPKIEWVEEDHRYRVDPVDLVDSSARDPRTQEQWSLEAIGVFDALKRIPESAKEVLVAVIDTGVDLNHQDLKNRIDVNLGEIPNNGIDDDHNGLVDDVNGWNFEAKNNDVSDDFHHGTHVAGIIGAESKNGIGITGIAPKARILPIRWTKAGAGWGEDAIAAIHYAVLRGARIINASWGGIGYSKALEEAVREAERAGILFVASAGNGHSDNDIKPRHPANLRFSNVVSVASVDEKEQLEKYSNYGAKQVELAAPGKAILSTLMNQQYGVLSGTSMAAAEVSGVATLLLMINPALRASQLKQILIQSVKPVSGLAGKTIAGGRVDAKAAAELAQSSANQVQSGVRGDSKSPVIDDSDLQGEASVRFERTGSGNLIKPDGSELGAPIEGLSIQFVRKVKGLEIPVEGLAFKAQVHLDGTYQTLKSDENGMIVDPLCKKPAFSATSVLESARYQVSPGSAPYELLLALKCGVSQKVVFEESSESGQVLGIWQTVVRAEKRLSREVGAGFWKRQIQMVWPAKGDYYSGDQVHLTAGHHWDVVAHELGHALYDQAGIGVFGGGQHYIDQCYSEALALSEGWASFFSGWLNLELSDPDAQFEYMVPRRAPIRFENIPSDVCGKSTNEWRVIGFFWDLIDSHPDPEVLSESFQKLWEDLKGPRLPSAAKARDRLLSRGWNPERIREIWGVNFPDENAP